MTFLRKKTILSAAAAVVLVAVIVVLGLMLGGGGRSVLAAPTQAAGSEDEGEGGASMSVKTVRPKQDPAFNVSIEQPAFVEAYYTADVMARAAGPIKASGITLTKGDRVKAGDVLLQIDVPDREQDVLQKKAVLAQRQSQLDLARANLKTAAAAEKAAGEWIKVKVEEVGRAGASERFREKELKRFERLGGGPNPAATADVIDEAIERRDEARAGSAAARAAVADARAELEKMQAKSEAAAADVKVAESLVGVAQKDLELAQTLLGFGTVRAGFDGVITRRNVDPGTFVQNATTARTEPLFTMIRDDIVTVYMKVPDKFAPFVTRGTEALILMDTLPGTVLRARVTRFVPSLDNPEHDRTMRVEVDLYNRTAAEYAAFLAREKAEGNCDLKSKTLPIFPRFEGQGGEGGSLRLLPGQYGTMRLVLRTFDKAYLLPRGAVVNQGGTSYVFLVKNGLAVKVPVEVQADNGEEVKVVLVEKVRGQTVKRDLTADEEVVSSNQGELSNGQAVKTTRVEW
jgi:multidrug resistance efflux pump